MNLFLLTCISANQLQQFIDILFTKADLIIINQTRHTHNFILLAQLREQIDIKYIYLDPVIFNCQPAITSSGHIVQDNEMTTCSFFLPLSALTAANCSSLIA